MEHVLFESHYYLSLPIRNSAPSYLGMSLQQYQVMLIILGGYTHGKGNASEWGRFHHYRITLHELNLKVLSLKSIAYYGRGLGIHGSTSGGLLSTCLCTTCQGVVFEYGRSSRALKTSLRATSMKLIKGLIEKIET